MIASLRRGECPSLTNPMLTGDGLLVRLTPRSGSYRASELKALALAAKRFGNGLLEVTQRGNLQIRGLRSETIAGLEQAVTKVGMELRKGLPIDLPPLGNLDPEAICDPLPVARQIAEQVRDFENLLGPKVALVIECDHRASMAGMIADLRLSAHLQDDQVQWALAIARDGGSEQVLLCADQAIAVQSVTALLGALAEFGRDARARHLSNTQISLAVGEVDLTGRPASKSSKSNPLAPGMIIKLRDQRFCAILVPAFGAMEAQDLLHLLDQSDDLLDELRLAPNRLLLLLCGSEADAQSLLQIAQSCGFIIDPYDLRLRISACSGAPLCHAANLTTRDMGAHLAAQGFALPDQDTRLHLSGCLKSCAKPSGPAISVIAHESGSEISSTGSPLSPKFYAQLKAAAQTHHQTKTVPA